MKKRLLALFLCLTLLLSGCGKDGDGEEIPNEGILGEMTEDGKPPENGRPEPGKPGDATDLGGDDTAFGEEIDKTGAYDGFFEGESVDLTVKCESGTDKAYKLEGTTLTFTAVAEESVYSISGTFKGNIVIDVGDGHKFDLELQGFSLVCDSTNPITVKSGDEVALKAKKDTKNYIYDTRTAIDPADETLYSGAIHSEVDLEIGGKGALTLVSENNNGIHSKDDLQVKNLTLFVACIDNSLKGNDGVELESCNTTLIASGGDCIKTTNSDISEKGNQRGSVSIVGGTHTLYAACDGIDAAYNVTVDDAATVLNIYTDKFSNYSKEVTATSSDTNYIRFTSNAYFYSVKYYNSDTDFVWVNAEYHSSVAGGRSTYYYYSYPKKTDYAKLQFFIYEKESQRGQDAEYLVSSDYLTPNTACDTFALTQSMNGLTYQWTNYGTIIQEGGFGGGRPEGPGGSGGGPGGSGGAGGPGGMGDGNSNKAEYSSKGIKAANEIVISAGTVNVKSHDDAIHANKDAVLENGASPLGNVTVKGGNVTVYSNDDGIHADGNLSVISGTISVTNAYEGLEGTTVSVSGGFVSVNSKDDGINATTQNETAITISGGTVYIFCSGDGIDSNSRSSYSGIVFSGGNVVVISTSGGNSAIDTERGYRYTGGSVVAVMPRGGMSNEATHCQDFSRVGTSTQVSLAEGGYLVAGIGDKTATVKMPVSMSAYVIVLGDSSATISAEASVNAELDENGVCWS